MMNANSFNSYARPAQAAQPSSLTPAVQQAEITYYIERLHQKATALENWMGSLNDRLRPATRQGQESCAVEMEPQRPTTTEIGASLCNLEARLAVLITRMEWQHNALEI